MYGHKLDAYEKAANTVRVGISTVRNWVKDFEVEEYIIDSMRGKHSKTATPILDNLEFREEFKSHVRQTSREQGTVNCLGVFVIMSQPL